MFKDILTQSGFTGLLHLLKAGVFPTMDMLRIYGDETEPFIGFGVENVRSLHPGEYWFPDPRLRGNVLLHYAPEANLAVENEAMPWMTDDPIADSLNEPLCTGGDLHPERLKLAYSYGIFPWFSYTELLDGKPIDPEWWAPLKRFVLYPDQLHISHSLRTLLNKRRYRVSVNEAFPRVIEACRTVNDRDKQEGAWLSEEIVSSYTELWKEGWVKSVEVWDTMEGDRLVGGLYGVWINGCFIGESMFSLAPSASKVALVGLCEWMRREGGKLIDLQIETPHLKSMGGTVIDYIPYLRQLNPTAVASILPPASDDVASDSFPAPAQAFYRPPFEYAAPLLDIRLPLSSGS